MPHDIDQKHQNWELAESRLTKARQAGWIFQITPKLSIEDGIEAMRVLLPKMRINKSETLMVRALNEYQREYDPERQVYGAKPMHTWASHIVDAVRYLAVNYRRLFEVPQGVGRYEVGF